MSSWFTMEKQKLDDIVKERDDNRIDFMIDLKYRDFETMVDSKLVVDEKVHEHKLQIFVDDVSKYEKGDVYEELVTDMFSFFKEPSYRVLIDEYNGSRIDDRKQCPHVADGTSIFDVADLKSLTEEKRRAQMKDDL